MNDLFTWAALGTVAGASAATLLASNVINEAVAYRVQGTPPR